MGNVHHQLFMEGGAPGDLAIKIKGRGVCTNQERNAKPPKVGYVTDSLVISAERRHNPRPVTAKTVRGPPTARLRIRILLGLSDPDPFLLYVSDYLRDHRKKGGVRSDVL